MKLVSIRWVSASALIGMVGWHTLDPAAAASNADRYKQLRLFSEVFDRVRSQYVEAPNEDQMLEGAIAGMLSSLDPHSAYMNPKEYQEFQVQGNGTFVGIGIDITKDPNGLLRI